jgi:hypothetical protein
LVCGSVGKDAGEREGDKWINKGEREREWEWEWGK